MDDSEEIKGFSRRMHEICEEKGIREHGRQTELAKIFGVSQKGARKWLEAEAFPRWELIIAITKWADVTIEWLMSGRGNKRPGDIYKTNAIANVVKAMEAMDAQQQYLVARLADQVAKPAVANDHDMQSDTNKPANGTGGK